MFDWLWEGQQGLIDLLKQMARGKRVKQQAGDQRVNSLKESRKQHYLKRKKAEMDIDSNGTQIIWNR